jgi:T-complex protein 1 subunit gamma
MEDSCVLRGVMLNKDVTHPKMRRHIVKPRILLLDCNLEYKKGESQVLTKPRCLNLRTLFLNIIC